jgi:hypothetical protein
VTRVALLAAAALLLAPAAASAPPGTPWRLAAQAAASGHTQKLRLFVRWGPTKEFGPQEGENAVPPIPKRVAFTVTQPSGHSSTLEWTTFCYPNYERGYALPGKATVVGDRVIYPRLYPTRVECDIYLSATGRGTGSIRVRVYAY